MKGKLVGDWTTGLAFSLLFLFAALVAAPGFFYGLETGVYDRFMRLSFRQPNSDIAVIGIDDRSIENIGRWPWSRDILAELVDRLDAGGARVVASTIFMGEPEIDPGYDTLRDLATFYHESSLAGFAAAPPPDAVDVAADLARLDARLAEAIGVLDYDARLAGSLNRSGNAILPMGVEPGAPLGRPSGPLPDYVQRNRLTALTQAPDLSPVEVRRIYPPVSTIGEQALALGHLSLQLDADGAVRFEPLVVRYYEDLYPSLALATAALSLNIPPEAVQVIPGEGVRIGRLHIETTPDLRMYNYYYANRAGEAPFPVDSFYDVFTGLIPADKYRDKVVLIGAAANGLGDWLTTPVESAAPPVTVMAHTLSALLEQHFYVRPDWAPAAETVILILLVLYLMFGLPRMRAGLAALCSLALCVGLLGAEFVAMNSYFSWLQLTLAALLVALGHLVVTVKRFRVIERLKQRADAEGAESNKMLGLAFQSQGQLDMAFDKFRRCPVDAGMLDVLYNLALDFERKRQFSKAGAAYQHIAEHDSSYRDVKLRLQRSRDLEDTVMLGAPVSTAGSLATETGLAKPQLGRYAIEREIGRGAMGTVYQGRDPKINRIVAIKTIALSHEFELEELQAVKERFFREAESAGRLKHPDIVTVYDAGEEHDLAYIAMEFLTGTHLNDYVATDSLMPAVQVLTLGARVADALDYAHEQGIVHRDIKPANIMFNPATDELKLTDFGIARITDSSRTKTGIVLGTPSYMAPEQLSGKNVTGRSDLFSLGVTLYQLLTGLLPFRADSMAALMYKIASEAHAPLGAIRPDLPDCVGQVIDTALEKDPERRVARGSVLAQELRTCCEVLVKDKVTI